MLSSTSVSPIGNIHRCVIVFTFVVQRKESAAASAWLGPSMQWMAIGFSFTNKYSEREGRTPLGSFGAGFDQRLSLNRSCVRVQRFWTLIPVCGPVDCDDVPKKNWSKSEIDWFISVVLPDEKKKMAKALFHRALNSLWPTRRLRQVCALRYLRRRVMNWPKARTRLSHKHKPRSDFELLNPEESQFLLKCLTLFFLCVERLWKDPLCVPLEFLFL